MAVDEQTLRAGGVKPWMISALRDSARRGRTLDDVLIDVGEPVRLPGTYATLRCHWVPRSGTGTVLIDALCQRLADQVVEYCIPPSRIREALAAESLEEILALQREAVGMFSEVKLSGEGGELLLYLLLEVVLELPQLLCKMPLKTNNTMHVHGADGIHGALLDDGKLALYWGEAKLHKRVSKAIDSALAGLAPLVLDDTGQGASADDLRLLRQGVDVRDPAIADALSALLANRGAAANVEYRGAAMVGFDFAKYPKPYEDDGETLTEIAATHIARWQRRYADNVSTHKLKAVEIELFCVPVPSVDQLRAAIRKQLKL